MKTPTNNQTLNKLLFLLVYLATVISTIGLLASPARAECVYEGQTYQTGDRVGPYVCMPDGSWQLY